MDRQVLADISQGFFKVSERRVDLSEAVSERDIIHYIVDHSVKRQVHRPRDDDDGRRIVGYSHVTGPALITHFNANIVTGEKRRQVGTTGIYRELNPEAADGNAMSADHYDNNFHIIGITIPESNGSFLPLEHFEVPPGEAPAPQAAKPPVLGESATVKAVLGDELQPAKENSQRRPVIEDPDPPALSSPIPSVS